METGGRALPPAAPLGVGRVAARRRIVDTDGEPVMLRGVGVGGWMLLENFINGFPGMERGLRARVAEVLGRSTAETFFRRLLDHLFSEADVAFLASLGVNCIRLPVNYRHLEDDAAPLRPREEGYRRLEEAVRWCARHGMLAVIDLHAAPGGQNPDWHSDNDSCQPLLFRHPHFQDRLVGIWEELARRFSGNPAVAAYDVINEPATGDAADVEALNALLRRLVTAIRRIDPERIIVIEGDQFASRFDALEAPFDDGLVYSTHNYTGACFGPGRYPRGPGRSGPACDREAQLADHLALPGTRFCRRHDVPQWAGEMGTVFNGPGAELPDRLRALDDELDILEEDGVGWSLWTYKDVGVMGWVTVDPASEYMELVGPVLAAKRVLGADQWMGWMPPGPCQRLLRSAARVAAGVEGMPAEAGVLLGLERAALGAAAATMLQPAWARRFAGMSESRLDEVLSAFSLARCLPNVPLLDLVRRHTAAGRRPRRSAEEVEPPAVAVPA